MQNIVTIVAMACFDLILWDFWNLEIIYSVIKENQCDWKHFSRYLYENKILFHPTQIHRFFYEPAQALPSDLNQPAYIWFKQ